jgi:hypothetical protein
VRHERRDTRQRFEQWARNPACTANAIAAIHGVPMAEVARREGGQPTSGQSPFAIARGQTFERSLFREDAASLTEALAKAGVLPAGAVGFRDFRLRQVGGPIHTLDDGLSATREFLMALDSGGDELLAQLKEALRQEATAASDMTFRPLSYWDTPDTIFANIKGEQRRLML